MDYVNAALPWTPLLLATIYSLVAHFYFNIENHPLLVSLLVLAGVWFCTKKWGSATATAKVDEEKNNLLKENQGLKDNLVKVYNMVQQQNSRPNVKPASQQAPPPPSSQRDPNHSAPTAPGPISNPETDVDGKPYL